MLGGISLPDAFGKLTRSRRMSRIVEGYTGKSVSKGAVIIFIKVESREDTFVFTS